MRVQPFPPPKISDIIKGYFRTYCSISNIHGVPYLVSKSRTERVVWAVLLTISIVFCIFMISKIWEKYERDPIVISFGTRDFSIHQVPFPAVTICPETQCSDYKFNYSSVYYQFYEDPTVVLNEDFKKFSYLEMVCNKDKDEFLTSEKTIEDDFFTLLGEVQYDCEITCLFLGVSCKQYINPIITEYGICYSFNILKKDDIFRDDVIFFHISENASTSVFKTDIGYNDNTDAFVYPLRAHKGGVDESLFFDFLTEIPDRTSRCNSDFEGFSIFIHSPLEIPRSPDHYITNIPDNKRLVVKVEPEVTMTSQEVKNFNADKRKCYLGHERALKFFRYYTQNNCELECVANFTLRKCDCIPFYLPRMKGDKICGSGNANCVSDAKNEIIKDELIKEITYKKTECDCRPSCTNLQYKSDSSLLVMNLKNDPERSWNNPSATILFKSKQFMIVERRELYGVFDFISNFGGLLGLFLGFSLISLIEIVYFCVWRVLFNKKT